MQIQEEIKQDNIKENNLNIGENIIQENKKSSFSQNVLSFLKETTELIVVTLVLLIIIRQGFIEARYIPSESMIPTLRINDRLIVEKVTKNLRYFGLNFPVQRGDIIVFYPPPDGNRGKDLKHDPFSLFARWTGLPFLPQDDAYIKRVIGLPGDEIEIKAFDGVYVNGQKLREIYANEVPEYDCTDLSHIPAYFKKGYTGKIIVPKGHVFVMGDNRNRSQDSHVWGFLDQKRIIGRAAVIVWRKLDQKPVIYKEF